MSHLVTDQQARKQALNIDQSYIVQAPAGSGKTELLSQRYLKLLAHCQQPEAVLAITFTRKAASEMRARIIGALERALQPPPEEAHKRDTWQLAKAVLEQDSRQQWQILQSPARLKIVTIDSLNASLARQMPLLSKMGSMSSPQENCTPLYLEAARRTLSDLENPTYRDDLSVLMLHMGNQTQRVQQLIIDMLGRRDQWLRHLGQHSDNQQTRQTLEAGFYQLIADHLQQLQSQLPAGFIHQAADLLNFAANNIEAGKDAAISSWKDYPENPIQPIPEQLLHWQGMASLLLTKDGNKRKRVDKNIGFPGVSSIKDEQLKAQVTNNKDRLMQLLAELDEEPLQLLSGVRHLPSLTYTDEQWHLLNAFTRVLLLAAANLQVVFSEQGKVDFAEISQAALKALENDERPSELALIMDYQLQHILVDEFQDTSQGQFKLLERLIEGWQAEDGRTLFLVGDPMQSIYRFREAEVGLYLRARQDGIGDVKPQALYLEVNFRSQQGIVDWVNDNLQNAFAQHEDKAVGAVCYSPSVPFNPAIAGTAVELHAALEDQTDNEAEAICEVISAYRSNNPDATIAILVRSRSHLKQIIPALQQHRLAFQAVDLDPLSSQPAIADFYSLTRAVLHMADRLHWLAVLRAPWCGLLLDDLQILAQGASRSIWQNCLYAISEQTLSSDGHKRLEKFIAHLQPLLQQRGRQSLKSWLQMLWLHLGGQAIYADENSRLAVMRYLQLIDNEQQGGYLLNFDEFDQSLEKLFAAADRKADGKLQIMTIHKSKGLEFDVVILPGLGRRGRPDQRGLLEWLERPNSLNQTDLLLSPVKASETDLDDPISNSLKAINHEKARHELTRLLYVALTRAKQQLHLFGHALPDKKNQPKPASNSLLSILWQQLEPAFQTARDATPPPAENPAEETPDTLTIACVQRLPDSWQLPNNPPLTMALDAGTDDPGQQPDLDYDWASETARHIGVVTHAWLEQLAATDSTAPGKFDPQQASPVIQTQLNEAGCHPDEVDQATQRVIEAITQTLNDTTGQWLLEAHQSAQNELALTAFENDAFKQYIIDRTFIDKDGVRWIVDYKTGSHQGGGRQAFLDNEKLRYQAQLDNYARLMSQLEDRPIRLALYFPMMVALVTWDYQAEAMA